MFGALKFDCSLVMSEINKLKNVKEIPVVTQANSSVRYMNVYEVYEFFSTQSYTPIVPGVETIVYLQRTGAGRGRSSVQQRDSL